MVKKQDMKKRFLWLFVIILLIGTCNTLQAQVVVETNPVETDYDDAEEDEDDDLEDDDVETVPLGEDEFAVTDGEGNEEDGEEEDPESPSFWFPTRLGVGSKVSQPKPLKYTSVQAWADRPVTIASPFSSKFLTKIASLYSENESLLMELLIVLSFPLMKIEPPLTAAFPSK